MPWSLRSTGKWDQRVGGGPSIHSDWRKHDMKLQGLWTGWCDGLYETSGFGERCALGDWLGWVGLGAGL